MSTPQQRLQSSFSIFCQASMRTANLLRIGMLTFPTLALTNEVYIYVDYESRYNATVNGKLLPTDGGESVVSFHDWNGFLPACTGPDDTALITLDKTGSGCKDLHPIAGITSVHFDAGHNDSRPLNISMPEYNLTVCTQAHVGFDRADTTVQHECDG